MGWPREAPAVGGAPRGTDSAGSSSERRAHVRSIAAAAGLGAALLYVGLVAFPNPGVLALAFLCLLVALVLLGSGLMTRLTFERLMREALREVPSKRLAAVSGLMAMADDLSAERLRLAADRVGELMADADERVRAQAARAAEKFAPRLHGGALSTLFAGAERLTRDAAPDVRSAAAVAISRLASRGQGVPPAAAARPLVALTRDREDSVRLWAIEALAILVPSLEASDRASVTAELSALAAAPASSSAWKAGRALVETRNQVGEPEVVRTVAALMERARGADPESAVAAIDLASEFVDVVSPEHLREAFAHAVGLAAATRGEARLRALRTAAAFAAGALPGVGEETAATLEILQADRDLLIRDGALLCLLVLGRPSEAERDEASKRLAGDVAGRLIALFHDEDAAVRRWARDMWPLAYRAVPEAERAGHLETLVELHGHENRHVRAAASAGLAVLKRQLTDGQARVAASKLIAMLESPEGDVKRHCTVTLVELYDVLPDGVQESVIKGFTRLAADPDRVVADQARDCLEIVKGRMRAQAAPAAPAAP